MLELLSKTTLSLFALVDPIGLIPLFLGAVRAVPAERARQLNLQLALIVGIGLSCAGLFGTQLLSWLGVSLGAMQVGGGLIALSVALTTVVGHQTPEREKATQHAVNAGVVPLGVPLLVGPAALSFVMAQSYSSTSSGASWLVVLVPPLLVAALTYAVFATALRLRDRIAPTAMDVIEKLVGFLLAGLAIELIAGGLKALFPSLG